MSPPASGANPRGPAYAGRASPTPSPPLPLESKSGSVRQRIAVGTKSQRNRGPGTSRWHRPLSSEGNSERRQYPWLAQQPVMHGRRRSVLASESRAYRRFTVRLSSQSVTDHSREPPPGGLGSQAAGSRSSMVTWRHLQRRRRRCRSRAGPGCRGPGHTSSSSADPRAKRPPARPAAALRRPGRR